MPLPLPIHTEVKLRRFLDPPTQRWSLLSLPALTAACTTAAAPQLHCPHFWSFSMDLLWIYCSTPQ